MAGWRVLTDCLKPGGLMWIGLYSELARQHIVKIREEIRELGIFNDSEKSIKIIEWPKIINLNVKDRLEISFYYSGKKKNERKIKAQGFGGWKGFKINDI